MIKQKTAALLAWLSRKILAKYQPKIIGITGSVGKTSARSAIYTVVSQVFRARQPVENYNNEFGLPFTIIGVKSPGRSPAKWLGVFVKALSLIATRQRYPEVLVLEMGIDRPGDMEYLLSIARPQVGVVTGIGVAHYEFFMDADTIEREKGKLAEALRPGEVLVVNADNPIALRQTAKTPAQALAYGLHGPADVSITDVQESLEEKFFTTFKAVMPSRTLESRINAVGAVHLSAVASALAVAEALKIDTDSLAKALQGYKPVPGRLNVIAGIKRSILIDDTYNAGPESMNEALALLKRIPGEFKMAVLGDMLELGALTEEAHEAVGQAAAGLNLDHLLTVGPGGRMVAQAARDAGMPEDRVISFDTSDQAKRVVQDLLKPAGIILVKGSQGMRMEKVVVEIMAEPMRARELLCRQYGKWLES